MSGLRHIIKIAVVGFALACLSSVAQAPLDIRIALVIGNAAYKNVPKLNNSVNDAKSMSLVLRKLGFKVFDVIDASKTEMTRAIEQMQNELKGQQAVAMLYYAGHGLQLDWHNYMVPVDAKLQEATDVALQTVDIEQVIRVFKESGTRINIIVLDACRDNPFSGASGNKGLAQVDAPPGTYLAYATAPGNVAEDGNEASGNGLFTEYLLKELQRPAKIEDVFKRVRLQVRQRSQGRQIPWDSSSMEDDFAFNDGKKFTFNPEDLVREARAAKKNEDRLMREAQEAEEREKTIALERELAKQRLAEAQKIQELRARIKAEDEAKERERVLAIAADQERVKYIALAQTLEQARLSEAQRLKDLELSKLQAVEEDRRKKMSAETARERQFAEEKAEWDKIKESTNKGELYAFLNKYPSGLISELASAKLELLDKAKIKPQADQLGRAQEFAPRRYAVNDVFEFVAKDGYTDAVVWKQKFTVLKVDDEGADVQGVRSNTSDWTFRVAHAGAQHSDNSGKFDPPVTLMPAGKFQVGYKWQARTKFTSARTNKQEWLDVSGKVVGRESIEVPAGKFDTFKVELDMSYQYGNRMKLTIWTDPSIGAGIRNKIEFRSSGSSRTDISVRDLVSFKRAS
jgi:uncharacterized caspase-like protein